MWPRNHSAVGQRHAQSQDARRPARPQQARQRDAERGEDREHCRQADDRDRQQPAEGRRIDQEGITDPIKAGEKIAEAEPPARYRGTDDAVPTAGSGAVNQPDQAGKVTNRIGQAFNGAMASADSAPAAKAINQRRHPQDRTMVWTRPVGFTATVECSSLAERARRAAPIATPAVAPASAVRAPHQDGGPCCGRF